MIIINNMKEHRDLRKIVVSQFHVKEYLKKIYIS